MSSFLCPLICVFQGASPAQLLRSPVLLLPGCQVLPSGVSSCLQARHSCCMVRHSGGVLEALLKACKKNSCTVHSIAPAHCSRQQHSGLPFMSAGRPALTTGHMPVLSECPGIRQLICTLAVTPELDSWQVMLACTLQRLAQLPGALAYLRVLCDGAGSCSCWRVNISEHGLNPSHNEPQSNVCPQIWPVKLGTCDRLASCHDICLLSTLTGLV